MIYHVTIGERSFEVDVGRSGITVDGRPVEVDFTRSDGAPIRSLLVDGASHSIVARRVDRERWDLHLRGRRLRADVVDERTRVIREMTGAGGDPLGPKPIVAPMPGMVVRVEVEEGQTILAGQGIVIVEAMKMENELKAEADGVVTRVHVTEGQPVEKEQVLVDLAGIPGGEEE